jgi:hypothetical protein
VAPEVAEHTGITPATGGEDWQRLYAAMNRGTTPTWCSCPPPRRRPPTRRRAPGPPPSWTGMSGTGTNAPATCPPRGLWYWRA